MTMNEIKAAWRDADDSYIRSDIVVDRLALFLEWANETSEYRVTDAFQRFCLFVDGSND